MQRLFPAAVVCGSLLLNACASQGARAPGAPTRNVVDTNKVVTVERWSERSGATVVWLRYPVKRPDAAPN